MCAITTENRWKSSASQQPVTVGHWEEFSGRTEGGREGEGPEVGAGHPAGWGFSHWLLFDTPAGLLR